MTAGRVPSALAVLLIAWPAAVPAQQFQLPGTAVPERMRERLAPQPSATPVAPQVTIEREEGKEPPGAEKLRFRLVGIQLTGNRAFGDADLLPLWQGRLGQDVSLSDIYQLAEAITAKYRNAGYILARTVVPPQKLTAGIVRLRVVEGYIDKVSILGSPPGRELIERIAAHLTEIRPITAAVLERYLL